MTDKDPKDSVKDKEKLVPNMSFESLVSLKTDKLTTALYLVTNALSDNDNLKWRLRDKSLELLLAVRLWAKEKGDQPRLWPNGLAIIDELVFLLSLGRTDERLSTPNLEVLSGEYVNLKHRFTYYQAPKQFQEEPTGSLLQEEKPSGVVTPLAPTPTTIETPPPRAVNKRPVSPENGRREAILHFLIGKNGLSIKDISRALPNVSTKTVQRELVTLVSEGRVKREGDRRWSRYSLL